MSYTKQLLIPYSGGIDSTFLALKTLKDYMHRRSKFDDFKITFVSLVNPYIESNKLSREAHYRQQFIEKINEKWGRDLDKDQITFMEIEVNVRFNSIFSRASECYDTGGYPGQVIMWMFSLIPMLLPGTRILLGYLNGETGYLYKDAVAKLSEGISMIQTKRPEDGIIVEYPLGACTKEDILRDMIVYEEEDNVPWLDYTTTCEMHTESKSCNCGSCRTLRSALVKLCGYDLRKGDSLQEKYHQRAMEFLYNRYGIKVHFEFDGPETEYEDDRLEEDYKVCAEE